MNPISILRLISGITLVLVLSRLSRPYLVKAARDLVAIVAIYCVPLWAIKLTGPTVQESIRSIDWSHLRAFQEEVSTLAHTHRVSIIGVLACYISLHLYRWAVAGTAGVSQVLV